MWDGYGYVCLYNWRKGSDFSVQAFRHDRVRLPPPSLSPAQARDGGGLVPQPPWFWMLAVRSRHQHSAGVIEGGGQVGGSVSRCGSVGGGLWQQHLVGRIGREGGCVRGEGMCVHGSAMKAGEGTGRGERGALNATRNTITLPPPLAEL